MEPQCAVAYVQYLSFIFECFTFTLFLDSCLQNQFRAQKLGYIHKVKLDVLLYIVCFWKYVRFQWSNFLNVSRISSKFKELQKKIDVERMPKCSIFMLHISICVSKIAFNFITPMEHAIGLVC